MLVQSLQPDRSEETSPENKYEIYVYIYELSNEFKKSCFESLHDFFALIKLNCDKNWVKILVTR